MTVPITILGTTVLLPTTGDTNYSAAMTQWWNLVSSAVAPIGGLYNTTTGHVGNLALDNSDKLTLNGVPIAEGTVQSVAVTGANGIGVTGSPITNSGTIALSLGDITPSKTTTPIVEVTSQLQMGSGTRITGNLGDSNLSQRVAFQNQTGNVTRVTSLGGTTSAIAEASYYAYASSDTDNSPYSIFVSNNNGFQGIRWGQTVGGVVNNPSVSFSFSSVTGTQYATIPNSTTPTNPSDLTRKDYVDSLVSGSLPPQTGNNGKFLTTDGTAASWAFVPSATWGSITGSLSSQTDLQTALDAKVDENNGNISGTLTLANNTIIGLAESGSSANTPVFQSTVGNNTRLRVIANSSSVGSFSDIQLWGTNDRANAKYALFRSTGTDASTQAPRIQWGQTTGGSEGDATVSLEFITQQSGTPAVRASINHTGTPSAATDLTPKSYVDARTAPKYETAVATAGQTVFNTTVNTVAAAAGSAYLQVFVNGVFQMEGAGKSFTVTGANQITFNAGLALNDDVAVFSYSY